jgi:hypothetical protein
MRIEHLRLSRLPFEQPPCPHLMALQHREANGSETQRKPSRQDAIPPRSARSSRQRRTPCPASHCTRTSRRNDKRTSLHCRLSTRRHATRGVVVVPAVNWQCWGDRLRRNDSRLRWLRSNDSRLRWLGSHYIRHSRDNAERVCKRGICGHWI